MSRRRRSKSEAAWALKVLTLQKEQRQLRADLDERSRNGTMRMAQAMEDIQRLQRDMEDMKRALIRADEFQGKQNKVNEALQGHATCATEFLRSYAAQDKFYDESQEREWESYKWTEEAGSVHPILGKE